MQAQVCKSCLLWPVHICPSLPPSLPGDVDERTQITRDLILYSRQKGEQTDRQTKNYPFYRHSRYVRVPTLAFETQRRRLISGTITFVPNITKEEKKKHLLSRHETKLSVIVVNV